MLSSIEAFEELDAEFKRNSDRGVAIISCSFIDSALREILSNFFLDDLKNDKKIFEGNGPLNTFSSKITIAYQLGLISKKEYKIIDTIRSIRNIFAHQIVQCDFNELSIKDKCKNISVPKHLIFPDLIPLPDGNENIPQLKIEKASTDNPRLIFQESVKYIIYTFTPLTQRAIYLCIFLNLN